MKQDVLNSPISLYLIATQGRQSNEDYVHHLGRLIQGGVDLVQMREKEMAFQAMVEMGRQLAHVCQQFHVPFIVNDNAEVAKAVGADGLHLGQDDLAPVEARKIVGSKMLIGQSTHDLQQVARAQGDPHVDMLGFGPVFKSQTKDAGSPRGCGLVAQALSLCQAKPIWAIGGINSKNLGELVAVGCHRIAMSSALMETDHPETRAAQLKELIAGS